MYYIKDLKEKVGMSELEEDCFKELAKYMGSQCKFTADPDRFAKLLLQFEKGLVSKNDL